MPRGAEKYGAWFDHEAADIAVSFFPRYLRHTEAEWYGRQFVLALWQEQIVRQLFGWKRKNGTRLIRQVYIEIPRKNGKTEFAAGLALLLLLADGEKKGQGYFMAVSKEQSEDTIFEKTRLMVGLSEMLMSKLEVTKTSIFCPELEASFKSLSSKAASKHGFSPSFMVADELHEWPDGKLHQVVHKGTAARRQPLEILITTAGEPGTSYGWQMHERALDILNGTVTNPAFLPMIFAADPEDDWRDPKVWAKANPTYPISPKHDFLEEEVLAAGADKILEGDFKRYHLNIWNSEAVAGIQMDQWDKCKTSPVTLESLQGRDLYGGLDLSSNIDITSLCLAAEKLHGEPGADFWWHHWIPKEGLQERIKHDRVRYDKWIEAGLMTATDGKRIDYNQIRAFVSGGLPHPDVNTPALTSFLNIKEIAFDRFNAAKLVTEFMADGIEMVEHGQGTFSMSCPSKEFIGLIAAGELNHGNNPIARWMATCTQFSNDGAENIKPVKIDRMRSIKRVDGIITAIMAYGRIFAVKEPPPSPISITIV